GLGEARDDLILAPVTCECVSETALRDQNVADPFVADAKIIVLSCISRLQCDRLLHDRLGCSEGLRSLAQVALGHVKVAQSDEGPEGACCILTVVESFHSR